MDKKRGPNPGEGGAPKKEIDFKLLIKLCSMQATLSEVAGFFDCSEDTIQNRVKEETGETFSAFFKRHSEGGKASLRRAQYQAAIDGNPTMLVWMGKQMLGQRDKQDIDLNDVTDRKFIIEDEEPGERPVDT